LSDLEKKPKLWCLVRPSPATYACSLAVVFVITRETSAVAAARKIPKRAVRAKSGAKGTAATPRSVEKPLPLSESDASHQMRQPEELRRARIELKAARDRYAALYDFSPAGHLT
jgi:hypothetical protein